MPFPLQAGAALALTQPELNSGAAGHLLQVLYVLAAVLAVILIVVIALAVFAWRKNKGSDLKP